MNQPTPTQQIAALIPEEARVIEFRADPHATLDPFQLPGYSEDLSCREREDLLDEAEWALENAAEPEETTPGQLEPSQIQLSQMQLNRGRTLGSLEVDEVWNLHTKPTPR